MDPLLDEVRRTLAGIVAPDAIAPLSPSLEDVFVLGSEASASEEDEA